VGGLLSEANQSIFSAQQTLGAGQSLAGIFSTVGTVANAYGTATSKQKIPGTTPQET
jgi:hypothetical protein